MISALLMIVAVATPTPPSVSATATPTTCGQAAIIGFLITYLGGR